MSFGDPGLAGRAGRRHNPAAAGWAQLVASSTMAVSHVGGEVDLMLGSQDVLVIGTGPAGVACAAELARVGVAAAVLGRADAAGRPRMPESFQQTAARSDHRRRRYPAGTRRPGIARRFSRSLQRCKHLGR